MLAPSTLSRYFLLWRLYSECQLIVYTLHKHLNKRSSVIGSDALQHLWNSLVFVFSRVLLLWCEVKWDGKSVFGGIEWNQRKSVQSSVWLAVALFSKRWIEFNIVGQQWMLKEQWETEHIDRQLEANQIRHSYALEMSNRHSVRPLWRCCERLAYAIVTQVYFPFRPDVTDRCDSSNSILNFSSSKRTIFGRIFFPVLFVRHLCCVRGKSFLFEISLFCLSWKHCRQHKTTHFMSETTISQILTDSPRCHIGRPSRNMKRKKTQKSPMQLLRFDVKRRKTWRKNWGNEMEFDVFG